MKRFTTLVGICFAVLTAPAAFALPNPYSVNCANLGGSTQNLNAAAGQAGFCRFGRAMINERTLYDATRALTTVDAVQTYLRHPNLTVGINGNPASLYCGAVGGSTLAFTDDAGNAVGICSFSDGSSIEEWTLYRGPSDSTNSRLTAVLVPQ